MASFKTNGSISDFQQYVRDVFSYSNDIMYPSLREMVIQKQRFLMRALKGIRKKDVNKTKLNLVITFSWFMSVCNRLHIDIEDEVWKRFPYMCSYCAHCPCVCKIKKVQTRRKVKTNMKLKPKSLKEYQSMFNNIYPSSGRSVADAGVHLAEEMGEVAEAINNYLGNRDRKMLIPIKSEMADFVSCLFGVANSISCDMEKELVKVCKNNCHVCHKAPCQCTFESVMNFKS